MSMSRSRGTTGDRPTHPPVPPPPSGSDGASCPAPLPFSAHQHGTPEPSPDPGSKPADGRDAHGRFVKGHAGGPGRPRRAVEIEYAAVLSDVVTPDDWKEVCQM